MTRGLPVARRFHFETRDADWFDGAHWETAHAALRP
nr:MjmU [Streptomyces sp.]